MFIIIITAYLNNGPIFLFTHDSVLISFLNCYNIIIGLIGKRNITLIKLCN